ncbi:unnamed protein product [Porites evermanni]|uniref:G-protein coupled receptors family 1 profile domain-containing protein n=1 Tax=Porites evermanni TaxID=104178 RepID=A0ABN8QTX8_9CNID|nr:unnamed protein product [Porites evermanni]
MSDVTQLSMPAQISFLINIIINIVICPFTVLLNVLVIMAVKRRPRLQRNSNILLACLAATDTATGLLTQPSDILYMILKLSGIGDKGAGPTILDFHNSSLRALFVCSSLHLMLVTFERITAIKFTMHYNAVVTKDKLKVVVAVFWFLSVSSEVVNHVTGQTLYSNVLTALTLVSCVLFMSISYLLLYQETRRHQKRMKKEQIPAVLLCFFPAFIFLSVLLYFSGVVVMQSSLFYVVTPFIRTSGMLNSFLNPLIYCLRQKEMRQFVLRFLRFPTAIQVVQPIDN